MDTLTDEARVPDYDLPDPLLSEGGERITSAAQWRERRRPELLRLFTEHVYGSRPPAPERPPRCEVVEESRRALGGLATRRQIRIHLGERDTEPVLDLLLYLPNGQSRPAPCFLGLNFWGNHSVSTESAIELNPRWFRANDSYGIVDHAATPASRGTGAASFPLLEIIGRGYGLATLYYGDIDPDYDHGFSEGIHALFDAGSSYTGGAISAWAWGLSRALDYLSLDTETDADRVAVFGHSRLGKTALWAAATDPRFAMAISNASGCGGAALFRRTYGETISAITTTFPHWFCHRFNDYRDGEGRLPIDQHELLALVAPRPVYVASARQDLWCDPRGEFLAARHAGPVYELLGGEPMPVTEWPADHAPAHGSIGYHIRAGSHALTPYDWEQFLAFADRHL